MPDPESGDFDGNGQFYANLRPSEDEDNNYSDNNISESTVIATNFRRPSQGSQKLVTAFICLQNKAPIPVFTHKLTNIS